MYCESFIRFYRDFMADFRTKLGVPQPKLLEQILSGED
jgi:hypothetical protein